MEARMKNIETMLSTLMKRTENFDKISGQIAALETKFEEKMSAISNAIHKMQSQIFDLEKAASFNEKTVCDIKNQTEYHLAKDTSLLCLRNRCCVLYLHSLDRVSIYNIYTIAYSQ